MLRKKMWSLLAVLALLSAIAVGCGSPIDDVEGLAPDTEQTEGETGSGVEETSGDVEEEGEEDGDN